MRWLHELGIDELPQLRSTGSTQEPPWPRRYHALLVVMTWHLCQVTGAQRAGKAKAPWRVADSGDG